MMSDVYFKHMNEKAQNDNDNSRRGFLGKILGLGVATAVGTTVGTTAMLSGQENVEKETFNESLGKLLTEMKYINIEKVPVIQTTANENILNANGWERLSKIVKEKFPELQGKPDAFITKKQLEMLLGK